MADKSHYNKTVKVPESVIEQIRELGMAAAIKKAKSGSASPEFVEGVRRFYPKAIREIDSETAKRETAGAGIKTEKDDSKSTSVRPSQESVQRRLGTSTKGHMSADAMAGNTSTQEPFQFDWSTMSGNRPIDGNAAIASGVARLQDLVSTSDKYDEPVRFQDGGLNRPIDLNAILGRILQPVDQDEERVREIAARMRR